MTGFDSYERISDQFLLVLAGGGSLLKSLLAGGVGGTQTMAARRSADDNQVERTLKIGRVSDSEIHLT
jgi:hypothetical protein